MKAAFHTLGCRVNQYETEAIIEQFKNIGYEIVDEADYADVYVINTCTVTHLADRKSRQYIRRMKGVNPDAVVAVTGCYAQVSQEEVAAIQEVDIITGTNEKAHLTDYVEEFLKERKRISLVHDYEELSGYEETGIITSMENRTRAYIKIQEGCNRFCSYCIIPYSRGKVRSRKPSEVLKEAQSLLDAGFKELTLTGINTALYGMEEGFICDVEDETAKTLSGVEVIIYLLNKMDGDFRIRLGSLEPTVVNRDYVQGLLKYDKLCHHLHLSIQSGSTSVISAMNRKYTREDYLDIVKVLKDADPGYGITTDIIVGFPGETEEDFEDSLRICEDVEFLKVHAFQYSIRKGTKAAVMKEQIPAMVKKERSHKLMEKAQQTTDAFLAKNQGHIRPVLFEEYLEEDGLYTGYTDSYIKVYVKSEESILNEIVDVTLMEAYSDGLMGEIDRKEV